MMRRVDLGVDDGITLHCPNALQAIVIEIMKRKYPIYGEVNQGKAFSVPRLRVVRAARLTERHDTIERIRR